MKTNSVGSFNQKAILAKIAKITSIVMFILGIIVLSILSFVNSIDISPQWKLVTVIALVSLTLNYLVWDTNYTGIYEMVMQNDITSKEYSIHKRYYLARKDWKYDELQDVIHSYNKAFIAAWKKDVSEITGRTIEELENGPYKKRSHKFLIWRLKHHKYPKTGIRTPNDVLYVLSVGKSDSYKIRVKQSEHFHIFSRTKKLLTGALGTVLAAAIVVDFISGDGWKSALVTLVINLTLLAMSFFLGRLSGFKGAKLKLDVAEVISEKLEEWKDEKPTEVPYKEEQPIVEVNTDTKVDGKEDSEGKSPHIEIV